MANISSEMRKAVDAVLGTDEIKQEIVCTPVYETKEILNIVIPQGFLKVHKTDKGELVLTCHPKIVDFIKNHCVYGHVSMHNDNQYVLPKGLSFYKVDMYEEGLNYNMERLVVNKEVLVDFKCKVHDDNRSLPFYSMYDYKILDGTEVLAKNTEDHGWHLEQEKSDNK